MDDQPTKKHPMLQEVQERFGVSDQSMPAAPSDSPFAWPMPKKPFSVQPNKASKGQKSGLRVAPKGRRTSSKSRGRRSQDWGY